MYVFDSISKPGYVLIFFHVLCLSSQIGSTSTSLWSQCGWSDVSRDRKRWHLAEVFRGSEYKNRTIVCWRELIVPQRLNSGTDCALKIYIRQKAALCARQQFILGNTQLPATEQVKNESLSINAEESWIILCFILDQSWEICFNLNTQVTLFSFFSKMII